MTKRGTRLGLGLGGVLRGVTKRGTIGLGLGLGLGLVGLRRVVTKCEWLLYPTHYYRQTS